MNDIDKSKKKGRGRHAAHAKPANSNGPESSKKPVENTGAHHAQKAPAASDPSSKTAVQQQPVSAVPHETAAMPQASRPAVPPTGNGAYADASGYVPGSPMLPIDMGQASKKGRIRPAKVVGIVFGILLAIVAVLYVGGAVVFMDRFMPNTTAGELDLSLKSSSEVESLLVETINDYALKVDGQGFSLKLSSKDAGLKLDAKTITDSMHSSVNPWLWPIEITRTHDETEKLAASYNEGGLEGKVRTAVEEFNKSATPPVNATVSYSAVDKAFIVKPESVGTALDANAVIKVVDKAVVDMESSVKITKNELAQPTVLSTDATLKAAADKANVMIKADLTLTMAGDLAGQVNADLVSQWVKFGDDLSATLDEAALTAWVDQLATACDTVGTQRTYTRPDGKVVTVAGGVYGWSVDHEALLTLVRDSVAGGVVATVEVPCSTTGTAYHGAGKQDWGLRYCDIDLSEQYARFYDETGALVWESDIVSGTPNGAHDTSTGVFWLNQKASPSKLKGTNLDGTKYESTVQYWMPFVGNVIGLHDADWQAAFGGTRYRDGFGSHGCVNLPPYKAAELYGIIRSGDVVVSHW